MTTSEERTYNVGGVMLQRPFKVRRLGHFGFDASRMEDGVRFYRDLLGFKISDVNDFAARPGGAELFKGVVDTKGYFMHLSLIHI